MDYIHKLAKELYELYEMVYNQIEPYVEAIITSNNKNTYLIENYLDKLLNIPTDKAYNLLKKLCAYCQDIDPEIAEFYMKEYEEIYDIKETKQKKKTYHE